MKTKLATPILLSLALVMSGLTGCSTFGKPDPGAVQFVASQAAFLGAQAALTYNGSYRAELELARQALQGFVAAGSGNVTNLQAILLQHFPSSLNGNTNTSLIISDAGITLYNGAGALVAKVDKQQWVSTYAQPIAQGLLQGISLALGEPTTRYPSRFQNAYAVNRR